MSGSASDRMAVVTPARAACQPCVRYGWLQVGGRPASPRRLKPLAKFFHCVLAQKIRITLTGLGKFDNSLSDQLIRNIAAVCKSKSETSHFERQTHNTLVSGSKLELPKDCEMGMEMGPAIGGLREAAPGGHGGRCAAGDPDSFGSEAVSRPWYVARCSNEVQLRTGP